MSYLLYTPYCEAFHFIAAGAVEGIRAKDDILELQSCLYKRNPDLSSILLSATVRSRNAFSPRSFKPENGMSMARADTRATKQLEGARRSFPLV